MGGHTGGFSYRVVFESETGELTYGVVGAKQKSTTITVKTLEEVNSTLKVINEQLKPSDLVHWRLVYQDLWALLRLWISLPLRVQAK